jgi:hypothetical protein
MNRPLMRYFWPQKEMTFQNKMHFLNQLFLQKSLSGLVRYKPISIGSIQQVISDQMDIFVGHFQAFVSQHVLYFYYVESIAQQKCSTRVPETVKMDGIFQIGFLSRKVFETF